MSADVEHCASRWGVEEVTRDICGCIEFGCTECCSKDDWTGCIPRKDWHRLADGHYSGFRDGLVVGRVGGCERCGKGVRAGTQKCSGCRCVAENTWHVSRSIQLGWAEPSAVDQGCGTPGDCRSGFANGKSHRSGDGTVVRGIGRSEFSEQRMRARVQCLAGVRCVTEGSKNICESVQLGEIQLRAEGDGARRVPGDDWSGLIDGEVHYGACCRVVCGVNRQELDYERVDSSAQHFICRRCISKGTRHGGRRIQLSRSECRAKGDGIWGGPGDHWSRLVYGDVYGGACILVADRLSWCKRSAQSVCARSKYGSNGWAVSERACDVGCCIELSCSQWGVESER